MSDTDTPVEWVKITTNMFDNRKIRFLRKLPEGNNIVLIWVMLLTLAGRCNAGGMIFLSENIPYTKKMLANELDFEESVVDVALRAFASLNMITADGDSFLITNWEEYQNVEFMDKIREQNRIRKRNQRARLAERLSASVGQDKDDDKPMSRDSHVTVTQMSRIENRDIENRDIYILSSSSTNVLSEANICAELQGNSTPAIILNDKTPYRATDEDIALWKECYPAVDVEQEMRKMAAWSDGNPKLRKTRKGVRRFITNWLARAQDEAGRYGRTAAPTNAFGTYHHNSKAYKCAAYLNRKLGENVAQYVPAEESVVQRWAADFDALSRSDGYDMAVVGEVLAFAMKDDFWRDKIPDGRKFRDKFTTLLAQMEGKGADG